MKIQIQIFLTAFITLFISNLSAQQKMSVHLKNGSIIRGRITEQYPDSLLKIYSQGNLWAFPMSDVEKISSDGIRAHIQEVTGFRFYADLGVTGDGASIKGTETYRFTKQMSAGIGIGFEACDYNTFAPVYADFRYDFRPTRYSPFVFLQSGYAWCTESDYYYDWNNYENYQFKGGFHSLAGLGMKYRFGSVGLNFQIGYRIQKASESYDYFQSVNPVIMGSYDKQYMYQRLQFGFGLSF